MKQTDRLPLELYDYAKHLMDWTDKVQETKAQYLKAQAPRNLMDFSSPLCGTDVTITECQTLVPWIRELQRRVEIEQKYLRAISGGGFGEATEFSTAAVGPDQRENSRCPRPNAANQSSLLEGEKQESSLTPHCNARMGKHSESEVCSSPQFLILLC